LDGEDDKMWRRATTIIMPITPSTVLEELIALDGQSQIKSNIAE